MNNPSPLIPQGSLLEQKNHSRSRVKVAFFCVVGVHVAAILVALLAQGCKREPAPPTDAATNSTAVDTNLPVMDTNQSLAGAVNNPPVPVIPEPAPPVPTAQDYVIVKGDSFYTIGKKFNVSTKAIQAANPTVDPNKLQIGHKLVIPPPTAPTTTPSLTPGAATLAPADTGEQTYKVKSGDSLSKIAKDHGTTINAITKLNKLTTTKIKVGDVLKIPARSAPAPTATPEPATPVAAPAPAPTTTAPPR